MDGLHFGNALTVQHNVLGGGAVGHILVTQNITAATGSESRVWHHYDQVGSVMMTSHAGGGVASQRLADAFGNAISSHFTGTWVDSWSASGHNTKEYDLEADLVYMYQRWYDPKSGTFASMAPYPPMIEHEYGFARYRPTQYMDSRGEFPVVIIPIIIGGIIFSGCGNNNQDGNPPNPPPPPSDPPSGGGGNPPPPPDPDPCRYDINGDGNPITIDPDKGCSEQYTEGIQNGTIKPPRIRIGIWRSSVDGIPNEFISKCHVCKGVTERERERELE